MNYLTDIRKINKVINKYYENVENQEAKRSKEFNKKVKMMVEKIFPSEKYVIIPVEGGYCESSYFIQEKDKFIYIKFGDYRYNVWYKNILYRTARDENDFSGGWNHYCTLLEDLKSSCDSLFETM